MLFSRCGVGRDGRESQPGRFVPVRRRQLVISRRVRREVPIGVGEDASHIGVEPCLVRRIGVSAVRRQPIEAPLERAHGAVGRRDRGEPSFPGVKERCEHRHRIRGHRRPATAPVSHASVKRIGSPDYAEDSPRMWGSHASAMPSSSGVWPCLPTSCSPAGRPACVVPQGIEIAGCPVTLNGCVRRSMRFLTGSATPSIVTDGRANHRCLNRQRRREQHIVRTERTVHDRTEHVSSAQRTQIVLRQHIPSGFEPLADARAVAFRHALERLAVVHGRFREHDREVHGSDRVGVRERDFLDQSASSGQPLPSGVNQRRNVRLQARREIAAEHADADPVRSDADARAPAHRRRSPRCRRRRHRRPSSRADQRDRASG